MPQKFNLRAAIIAQMFNEAEGLNVCPYIARNQKVPYCAKDLNPDSEVSWLRKEACDITHLELLCLSPENFQRCLHYKGKRFLY